MKLLIEQGRVIDPASGRDEVADIAIAAGRIVAIGKAPGSFTPDRRLNAAGCIVAPGLIDLCARLGEPGNEHARMLESEVGAAIAGGVTSLVCPPDTDPVLDEPGLVEMLKMRAERLHQSRVLPLGALTRGLAGEQLTEMAELTEAGCIAFGQADAPLINTQVLHRALQYASTFGYAVWLRPQDAWLGAGVAASGAIASRMGLAGIPAAAETIALQTLLELLRAFGAGHAGSPRVHICRLSSAKGVALLRQAKAEGLNITADAKTLPFAQAQPGAAGLELLLPLALRWGQAPGGPGLRRALQAITSGPAHVLGAALGSLQASLGRLTEGGMADVCVFNPQARWPIDPAQLRSQGAATPFARQEATGQVRFALVGGQVAFEA